MARAGRGPIRRFFGFFISAYKDNVFFLAAALSFNALLAAIPFAMLFLAVLGYVLDVPGGMSSDVRTALHLILPDQVAGGTDNPLARSEQLITSVIASREDLSRFGIPLFLLFSARLFRSARIALNQILGASAKRRWFFGLARDLVLVVVTTVLFAAGTLVAIPVFSSTWGLDRIVGNTLAVAFSTVLFYAVYAVAPARKLKRHIALIAAFFASFAFEAAKILYGVYLSEFVTVNRVISHANAIALLLFVTWIYYTAAIFLLGGEIAKAADPVDAT